MESIRLGKVAGNLNVGLLTICEYLNNNGYHVDANPNLKISIDVYELLKQNFLVDLNLRKISNERRISRSERDKEITENGVRNISLSIDDNNDFKRRVDKIETISNNELIKNNPKVFISYSWDDAEHKEWVLKLSHLLISNGIVVILDQYELSPGDNLTYFMEKNIPEVDKVIMILTPNYKLKADKRSGGVGYEYSIITQELFENIVSNKFIPILRKGELEECVPTFLKSRLFLDMRKTSQIKDGLKQIIFSVYNKRLVEKPDLGPVPDLKKINFDDLDF
jgi:hypothetical protein